MNNLSDGDFVSALEGCRLSNESFHHRDHLRLAWLYLRRHGPAGARLRIAESIRRFAAHHGSPDRYHETITQAWLLLIAEAASRASGHADFDAVLAAFPDLLDKDTPRKYYSEALLQSAAARTAFVEPDLAPLGS